MMRIALFVDAANMFYAQRDNGWEIDYKKVYKYFTEDRDVACAYYFTGSPHFEDTDRIRAFRGFKRFLIHTGYTVIDKEVKVIIDETTREKIYKANLDVDIAFQMLVNMGNFGEMVLLGGDSDFVPIIQHLRNHGKTVICVGRRRSTALELINAANVFIDLNSIRKEIEKIRGNS